MGTPRGTQRGHLGPSLGPSAHAGVTSLSGTARVGKGHRWHQRVCSRHDYAIKELHLNFHPSRASRAVADMESIDRSISKKTADSDSLLSAPFDPTRPELT